MEKSKKKPNLFRSHSPRMTKIITALFSALVMIGGAAFIISLLGLISLKVSAPGMDIASLFKGFDIFTELLFAIFFLLAIAFGSAFLYNYLINKDRYIETRIAIEAESPLTEAAKGHEQQIMDMLTIIAKPLPGKAKLNRARTAQFLRALIELQLIDANYPPKNLMVWVENVTNYKDGNVSAFNQALKDANPQDTNVLDFQKQIQQVLDK